MSFELSGIIFVILNIYFTHGNCAKKGINEALNYSELARDAKCSKRDV